MGKTAKYNLPYPESTDKANVPQDLKNLAEQTETALDKKVNTEDGKRLITNTEAEKLAGLSNYDDTELKEQLTNQATKIEELEEENKQLIKDHKPIPFNAVSSHLVDTGELPILDFGINGGIEQDSRGGYNLYNLNNISSNTKNGVTFTVNTKKGSITLNGTCSAAFTINMNMSKKIPIGTVLSLGAFNSKTTSSSMSSIRLNDSINGIQGLAVHFYTVNNKVENYTTLIDVTQVQIRVETNETYTDFEIFPMLRLGATLGDFELYGAMPSIEFPSEVKGVSGHYDTVVENKQLFNGKWELGDINSSTGTNTNSSASIRTVDFIKINPDSKYTVSRQDITNGKFRFYDKDKNYIGYINKGGEGLKIAQKLVFIPPNNCYYMKFVIDISDLNYQLQLEVGDVATEHIEHQEQNLPIDIPFNMYSGKPYKENGKWYRPIEWVKKVLTGSESYALETSDIYKRFNLGITDIVNIQARNTNVKSNYFKSQIDNGYSVVMAYENRALFYPTSDITTVEEFQALVKEKYDSGSPIYIVYKLANADKEEITDATLIAQLEELQKVKSYYEVTNINSYRPTEDVAEMKLSGNALMSNDIRMSKIENAILSLGGI